MDRVQQAIENSVRDSEEVMDFLKGKGPSLEGYRREYLELQATLENLTDSMVDSERENETFRTEINQLKDQIGMARKNIDETLLSKDTLQSNVDTLRENKSHLMEREHENRNRIQAYEGKFEKLREDLDAGSGWTVIQEEEKQELEKERDFLSKKLDNRMNIVSGIRIEVDQLFEYIQTLDTKVAEVDEVITKKRDEIAMLKDKAQSRKAKSKELEQKVKSLQFSIQNAEDEYHEFKGLTKSEDKTLSNLERVLQGLKDRMDGYIHEYEGMLMVAQTHTTELERQKLMNKNTEKEIEDKKTYIQTRKLDLEVATKEYIDVQQLRTVGQQKINEIDKEKESYEMKRDELQKKIDITRDQDCKVLRKQNEMVAKSQGEVSAEIEVLRKKYIGSEKTYRNIVDLIQLNKNAKRNLAVEKKILQDEVSVQFTQIQQLLLEKEKHEHDAEITNQEYYTALEELKLQELQIRELQKKISDDQNKLKHKQNLYEAVRADRNLYSKQLIESQDEINALKRKFRLTNHQIDQIKEEISSKDHAIVKEHFYHHSVDKERELLKNELTKIRKQVVSSEQIIENQHVEVLKLTRIIEEADLERQRQSNELIAIVSEKNLLTAQVVNRNGELRDMYDKIKIQRSSLRIGEKQYHNCMLKLKEYKKQLVKIVEENNNVITELTSLENLRRSCLRLEKDLLQEQSKSQALTIELERPMNVHRWRILESSDPQRYEKIRQIQDLQKELIEKSDMTVRSDLMIQEKEKVYVELKNIITRQPGPEVEEQVLTYQFALKDKVKQLSSMNNELDMYRMQVDTFKNEIVELDCMLASIKKSWIKAKKLNNTTH